MAPMAGVTDVTFRRICRRFGAAIVYSEFLSTDGLVLNHMNQEHKLILADDEHPVAFQLFGAKTQTFGVAAKQLAAFNPDLIDLNFGCPVKKVVKNNGGSAILRDLELMRDIVYETVNSVDLPVTVKMRAGWDHDHLVFQEAAKLAVEAGAKVLTLHARTRSDKYEDPARWEYIREMKRYAAVPVIGNGDVDSPQKARQMLDETGCDMVMIGRAALGRPWIFAEINTYLDDGRLLPEPRMEDRLSVAWYQLTEKLSHTPNEAVGIKMMRKQMAAYLRGLPHCAEVRGELMKIESLAGLRDLFRDYVHAHGTRETVHGSGWLGDYLELDHSWVQRTTIAA
ncbi:MAG: tRNA dihydrouridine synthase DusB [Candidatus Zixiibacteriota bacterium]